MFGLGWGATPDAPIEEGESNTLEGGNTPNVMRCPDCYNQRPEKDTCEFCNGKGRLKKVEESRDAKGTYTKYEAY